MCMDGQVKLNLFLSPKEFSNHRTQAVYDHFFRTMKRATKDRWEPKIFILDMELALRNSILLIFVAVKIHLCYFHVKQACKRWCMNNRIGKANWKIIRDHITSVALAMTREDFEIQKNEFEKAIKVLSPVFLRHFQLHYLNPGCSFPVEYWCCFSKPENTNRTNNITESRNKQIKKHLGLGLSVLKFTLLAKEYHNAQKILIPTERNTTWERMMTPKKPTSVIELPMVQDAPSLPNTIQKGDTVKSLWKDAQGEVKYYKGVVERVNPRSYSILWEDGIRKPRPKNEVILVSKK